MNKKVALIIPVYNTSAYLRRCLDSVINQTYKDILIICVNDGSTDNSLEILKEYKKGNKNITIISQENGGLSSARNSGLRYIQKDIDKYFVSFLDSDDFLEFDYIQNIVNDFKNGVSIVCSQPIFTTNTNSYIEYSYEDSIISSYKALEYLLQDSYLQSHATNKMFDGLIMKDVYFDETISFMEDQHIMYRIFLLANKICLSSKAGYHYWKTSNSLTTSLNDNKILQRVFVYYQPIINYELFKNVDQNFNLYNIACTTFCKNYLLLFYKIKFSSLTNVNKDRYEYLSRNFKQLFSCVVFKNKNLKIRKKIYSLSPFMYKYICKILRK